MTERGIFACCFLKTIGKTAVFMSQWSALQSLVHAAMWHNTEPRTLGISLWATLLFIGAICIPGLLYLLASAVLLAVNPRSSCMELRCRKASEFFITSVPAVMLWTSSLPLLDMRPEVRTCLLSCAVVFVNLYVALIPCAKSASHCKNFSRVTAQTRTPCPNPATKLRSVFHAKMNKVFRCSLTSSNIGSDLIIAACATMGARWCYGSINVFYENCWASLILASVVVVYATVMVFSKQISRKASTCWPNPPTKRKSSKCKGFQVPEDKCNKRPDFSEHERNRSADGSGDKFLPVEQSGAANSTDSSASHVDEDLERNSGITPPIASGEDNSVVGIGVAIIKRPLCANMTTCFIFIHGLTLAVANGSLGAYFLWIFTSPSMLCLWGEVEPNPAESIIYGCFSLGCLLAITVNVEEMCAPASNEPYANDVEKSEVRQMKHLYLMVDFLVACMMVAGCSIVLHTRRTWFLFGAAMLSIASPILLRIVLAMSHELVSSGKSLGQRRWTNILTGTLLTFGGLTFIIFHFLGIMFINPQMTSLVHGKMGAILWPQVLLGTLPLICGLPLRRVILFPDRFRSSSAGPLLAPDSPNSASESPENKILNESDITITRKYRKLLQVILLLTFVTVFYVSKSVSLRSKHSCGLIDGVTSTCDASKKIAKHDLRVMSWNILLGHTMTGRSNLGEVAELVDEYDPHVLALQEATGHPPYWGGKDVFGYLGSNTKSCRKVGAIVNPRLGSFEVGILSQLRIISQSSLVLPNGGNEKVPYYTMAKMSCQVLLKCNISDEQGSGFEEYPRTAIVLHIYTLHAVYKNWTCDRLSQLSCEQMKLVHDDIAQLPAKEPVIVMGDFNANPSEPELDIWFQSDLSLKSALWPSKSPLVRNSFNYTCGLSPKWDDRHCDCDCRDRSSDPPKSTLLNRRAAVDHIFYRGLKLVETAKILDQINNTSDHYPVVADFVFE